MFDNKDKQLADLEAAYSAFMETMQGLSPQGLLASLGDWTPRDIAAHFIGWNRITLAGCRALREGAEPFYFYGTNDYRKVNAKFLEQFPSADRDELLKEIASTKEALVTYLKTIDETEWELNTGVVHYRGNPYRSYATLHYGNPAERSSGHYDLRDGKTFADDFHVFSLAWEPTEVRWYLDGNLFHNATEWFTSAGKDAKFPAPHDQDFHLLVNVAVGGHWPGSPDETSVFPQMMYVDYIRVYQHPK